ncbi:RtcB family protein [Terrihabitans soli]|nr:RtcB family protein [Terrihabitans soli]
MIKLWTEGVPVEDGAMQQLEQVASLPFIFGHVAVMPDVHYGLGATIGSVIPTKGAVVPAAVGVDIGCGIAGWRTGLRAENLPHLPELRNRIERAIPHGRTNNGGPGDRGAWEHPPASVRANWHNLFPEYELLVEATPALETRRSPIYQLGTLGTGNHFIELAVDQDDHVWILLHSGSRGAGAAIANHYVAEAKRLCAAWHVNLPNPDLAFFPEGSDEFDAYLEATIWAQGYAAINRELMLQAVWDLLDRPIILEKVETPHNFVARENHKGQNVLVTRKGSSRARKGDRIVIPGSMGAKSYIVTGKGNPESFNSCSHGAGRAMSRTAARKSISMEDHLANISHVECRKTEDLLDESPAAYKDIDAVIAAQSDLIEVTHTLRQVLNVKG